MIFYGVYLILYSLFYLNPEFSQIDYSGSYGYSSKVVVPKFEWKPKAEEINQCPSGWLTLFKIANNQSKFWLIVSKGWPNYHRGEIDGIIEAKGNIGVLKRKSDYNDSTCILFLHFFSKYIAIEQQDRIAIAALGRLSMRMGIIKT